MTEEEILQYIDTYNTCKSTLYYAINRNGKKLEFQRAIGAKIFYKKKAYLMDALTERMQELTGSSKLEAKDILSNFLDSGEIIILSI